MIYNLKEIRLMMREIILSGLILLMVSCSKDTVTSTPTPQPTPKFSIVIAASEGGSVNITGGTYDKGTKVTVTATPDGEYLFDSWSDGSTENPREITITSNLDLTANFVKKKYSLSISTVGEGSVSEEVVVQGSVGEYNSGTTLRLTAVPDTNNNWEFVGWEGDIESSNPIIELDIMEPKNVVARFMRYFDYNQSWDVIRHMNDVVTLFKDLDYYPDCGFDTTNAMADFNSDGYVDILLAPQCSDEVDARQPPIAIFLNDGNGIFELSDITIENNIGVLSGNNATLVGDFNNDAIPDVFFASHNGHGGPGGFPSILLSSNNKYIFSDISTELGWYGAAASSDFDRDGDLDAFISGNKYYRLTNDNGSWTPTKEIINNLPGNITNINRFSFIDMNNDGFEDIVFNDGPTSINLIYRTQNGYDYEERIAIPYPIFENVTMQMEDKVFYDLDQNGYLDIVTWSYPAAPEDGSFTVLQAVFNYGESFEDRTSEVFPNVVNYNRGNYDWLRFHDLNDNGRVELFENRQVENWFHLEWNGSSFEAVD